MFKRLDSSKMVFRRVMVMHVLGLLVMNSLGSFVVAETPTYNGMISLLTDTLDGYDSRLRPRANQVDTVEVNASFVTTSIVNFDTSGQLMLISGYFTVTWTDELIKWEEGAHLGVTTIQLGLRDIWYPQLVLRKSVGSSVIGNMTMDTVQISSSGLVHWKPSGIYGFLCSVDVSAFPFDTQTCKMEFYITDHTIDTAKLHMNPVHTDEYKPNAEWDLKEVKAGVELQHNTNVGNVEFTITRRSKFAVITLILPLSALTVVNLFAILMPIESEEKNALAILIFLSYAFYTMLIRDALPHNSLRVSSYVIILCVTLFLSALFVVYVIVESYIYSTRGNKACKIFKKPHYLGKKEIGVSRVEIAERAVQLKNCEQITWSVFLRRLDTVIFVITSFFMILFSLIMFLKITDAA